MELSDLAADVGVAGAVTVAGHGTRGGALAGIRCVHAPSGIDWIQADEMTLQCGAGTPLDDLAAALAPLGQRVALPAGGTVGGALACGRSSVRRLGDGPMRDVLLQARYIGADGVVVKAGGPTVKNVSGFDVCRLLVGSRGTLGFLGEVILRTRPIAQHSQWFAAPSPDPHDVFARLHRPVSVLWDGTTVWALMEGHPDDVREQSVMAGLAAVDGPPVLPAQRVTIAPAALGRLHASVGDASFVAEVGVGTVHLDDAALLPPRLLAGVLSPQVRALRDRMKHEFDPTGRLNPGVDVG